MRIGLNLLYLIPGIVGGTEIYAAGLLQGLAQVNRQDEFIVFVNQESENWFLPEASNFYRVVCPVLATSRIRRYLFEQLRLPRLLAKYKIDVVHSLGYVGPLLSPSPSVVTIHDLNYITLKHTMPAKRRVVLQFFSMQAARRADHVITISNFSKEEITRAVKLNPDKITVTHLGPMKNGNTNSSENWVKLSRRYGIQEPYVAVFGGGSLHKNIPRLIQAFALVKDAFPHFLVLIGRIPSNVDLSSKSIGKGVSDRILTTGYVPEEHILPLLSHAALFVLPSLYEGFGLPMLEAQQAAVTITSSTAGSLPEVGGDGALYFDPTSVENIAQTIRHCLADADLRSQLILKGLENLNRFSWDKTAKETLTVYQNIFQTKREKFHFVRPE